MVKYQDVKLSFKKPSGGVKLNINTEKNDWVPKNGLRGSSNWTRLTKRFKTTAKTNNPHRAYLRFYLLDATGTVWIDNVVIKKVK